MKISRVITLFLLLGVVLVFFTMQGQFDENGQWGLVGVAVILGLIYVFLGDTVPQAKPVQTRVTTSTSKQVTEQEQQLDIPEVVVKDELDGATLRERKLAKTKAKEESETENMVEPEPDDDLDEVEVTIEEVHVADEFVVETSPQSIEDANIVATINEKRERHDTIRARIEERRRGQMAEIRASTARMWESHSAGEDLVTVIQTEGHGNQIIEEPETAEAGHVYGASLIRIDESTILKLRVPLDEGFVAVDDEKSIAAGMPMPLPEGIPSPEELGLALPPPPGASGALAALRDEIEND